MDARQGSVNLISELPSGETQTGLFGAGRFVIRRGRRGYVDLYLRGPVCRGPKAKGFSAAAARRPSRPRRRLWGRDEGGRFRTHGRHSHATVRGTR